MTHITYFNELVNLYGKEGARYIFELICKELLMNEISDLKSIRPNPGDGGVDIFSGTLSEKAIIFQVKFFPEVIGDSQKESIRSSFNTILKNEIPCEKWILLLPKNLDQIENKWFEKWKNKSDIDIDYWGEDRLRGLLIKYPIIEERYFQRKNEIIRKPKPTVAFLHKNGIEAKEIQLKYFEKIVYQPLDKITIEEVDKIVKDEYSSYQSIDFNRIMTEFNSDIENFNNFCLTIGDREYDYYNQHFFMFAVRNDGNCPLINCYVDIYFEKELEISDLGLDEPEIVKKPLSFRDRINQEISLMSFQNSIIGKSFQNHYNLFQDIVNPLSYLMNNDSLNIPFNSLAILESNKRREPIRDNISVNKKKKHCNFWLKKVMHGGNLDHHINGVYISFPNEGEYKIFYEIIADNIDDTIQGKLSVILSKDNEQHLTKWDPFKDKEN